MEAGLDSTLLEEIKARIQQARTEFRNSNAFFRQLKFQNYQQAYI